MGEKSLGSSSHTEEGGCAALRERAKREIAAGKTNC